MKKVDTNLDFYKKKLLENSNPLKPKTLSLTGRDDLQPIGTSARLKKRISNRKERVTIRGNVEIYPQR